jgi:hypothetical protein
MLLGKSSRRDAVPAWRPRRRGAARSEDGSRRRDRRFADERLVSAGCRTRFAGDFAGTGQVPPDIEAGRKRGGVARGISGGP